MEELTKFLDLKFDWNIMAATHLAYSDLALDNFYGTESNQNADPSIQSKQRKSKFSRGDASPNPDALAYCKKSPHFLFS